MNFQELADSFYAPTCIISIKTKENGEIEEMRLVAANAGYIEPFEKPVLTDLSDKLGIPAIFQEPKKFVPNSLYEKYLPKDLNFEEICYRAAVERVPLHTYFNMNDLNLWFDIFCMPLEVDGDDLYYCSYSPVVSDVSKVGLSSGITNNASESVVKTCIKLHSAEDFSKTIDDVIQDIRLLCRAEVCTIMLGDKLTGAYKILATSIEKNSKIRRVTEFAEFEQIAASWFDMIEGRDCIIIKEEKDWEYIRKINNLWYLNLKAANVTSVVFFPLRYADEVLGFIWATNFDTANTLRIKETLELTTFFISSKLSSYKMMEHLKKISYTDQLTGIPNRIACIELIGKLIKMGKSFSVVSVDINGFKSINDTMGFDTGNKVLVEIASRWKEIVDEDISDTHDYIARMGGDEFAFVICDYGSEDVIMNTIMQYESALKRCLTVDGCDLYITASFGYSVYPHDATTSDSLVSHANAAMCEVKKINSSNHILRYSPEMLKTERTLEVENKLRASLEKDGVFYHLQPQFDMSHKLRGFEALARMKDTEGNFISPGEFIPVAEKVGLVDKIDGVVFKKAAFFIGELIKRTKTNIVLSVNVSVRHLMKNDFLDEVRTVLNESGLPAKCLEIEITESIMIDSADKALKCIDELHKMGIQIAIDDFGTGYSSLSYLSNFPANILKIDKSFIDKMNTGDKSKQYVAAIISIGHIMGFEVVSEGVEEDKQLETLKEIGCDFVQGYIWGKPMPAEDAEKLIIDNAKKENN